MEIRRKRFLILIVIIGILLAVWNFPIFLRAFVVEYVEKMTGLETTLSSVSFKTPSTLVLKDLRLLWKGRERLRVEDMIMVIHLRSLFSETIEVEKIVVEDPFLWIHRYPDKSLDLFRFFHKRSLKAISIPKRKFLIRSFSIARGEVELLDESVREEPYTLCLSGVTLSAQNLSLPPRDKESPITFHAFVRAERFPPSGSLRLEGWVNPGKKDFRFGTELRQVDLALWNPYTAPSIQIAFERGWMDLDGELKVQQKELWGVGLVRIRDLVLMRTPTSALFEAVLGISQENLIAFLKDSHGELTFPLKVSGRLDDPHLELGELFTDSIRQSLARTLQKGVGEVIKVGSGTLEIVDLEKRAKRVVKELKKTLRLDWLLTGTPETPPEIPPQMKPELMER